MSTARVRCASARAGPGALDVHGRLRSACPRRGVFVFGWDHEGFNHKLAAAALEAERLAHAVERWRHEGSNDGEFENVEKSMVRLVEDGRWFGRA